MTDSVRTLLTASGSLLGPPAAKSLFSQHYLQARLSEHPEWAADPRPAFETVAVLWERVARLGRDVERGADGAGIHQAGARRPRPELHRPGEGATPRRPKARLESWLAELVNATYDLTSDEVTPLWRTALLRMPMAQAGKHDDHRG